MVVNYLDVVGIKKESDVENIRFSIIMLHQSQTKSNQILFAFLFAIARGRQ